MSKFVIECPHCGKFAEAKTGFFARKKIDCSCGYTIHVPTDKLSSRTCPHCGNNVIFDQSQGAAAKCPVCGEPINTLAEQDKTVEFSCGQCGIRLRTAKGATAYICPVCDHENIVAERVKTEQIRRDGLASIIKYEGDNETLVWKHPIEDFNLGSQLIVHESQEAIFFRDGQALDLFGPGRYTLETQQLPILEKLYQLPTDTQGTFHSEVYYVNLATQMGIKWGTDSKVRLFDPMTGMHMELGASGEFNIRVVNSRKLLLKLVGTTGELKQEQLLGNSGKGLFRSMVMTQVKSYLAAAIRENAINILEIDERLMELSEALRERINPRLAEYGLEMPEFFVSRVVTPDDDPNFRRMKEQFAEQYLNVRQEQIRKNVAVAEAERKAVEAQTAARMKIISAQGDAEALKIQKQAEAEAYRMQAAAEAEEMRLKGYTYQQETARKVGLEAMQNGITGNGSGMGGLGDLAGLGVTLGAMGSVVNMTKDALNPVMESASQMGQAMGGAISGSGWDCPECGAKNITSKFCPECGVKKPEPKTGWDCPECGTKNIQSKFCPECGARKPEPKTGWDCPECGTRNILSKFCPECGHKRGE
ncbi:MAG: SPFH domain-containing protein [Candidatus Faecousia sp.]|nr:SPFH domain-containing protein [Candidatus Faecousia sp.]